MTSKRRNITRNSLVLALHSSTGSRLCSKLLPVCALVCKNKSNLRQKQSATKAICDQFAPWLVQMQAMDLQAMAWSLAASRVRPLVHMNRHKPSPTSCNFSTVVFIVVMAICLQAAQTVSMLFLTSRPWFPGGNGTAHLVS
jgi:hypothetical protein